MAENPQGSRQGVGWGVESPQGIDTPGEAEFPQRDKTPGVTTMGEGEPREDGQGRGRNEIPPTTQANGAQGDGGDNNEWMGGPRTVAPLQPQRGTAADNGSTGTLRRHTAGTAGTNGARPEHGALVRRNDG